MATAEDRSENCFPMMSSNMTQRPIKKQSRIAKRKFVRKSHSHTHFRFGGNRKDPLNLNALIRKKNQLTQNATSTIVNNDNATNNNDRPVEILLQPDIFDPLCLDTSSRNDVQSNNLYSDPSNSTATTHEQFEPKIRVFPQQKNRYMKKRRNLPPPRYGNFQGYYGYRQPNHDQRLRYLEHDWFHNKQVLDIGCHTGHVTFYVAEQFQPAQIVGVDIDQQLIQQAQNQLCNRIQTANNNNNNNHINLNANQENKRYPYNMRFEQGNFVLDSDEDLANVVAEYDTILALSVTKWVHLNFGDQGLKRFFKRIYRALLPGGRLLLEPQPWSSYRLKRRMTKDITEMYNQIQFKPTEFVSYLLSTEVGFETCTTIATPDNTHRGFQRSMFLFIKTSNFIDN